MRALLAVGLVLALLNVAVLYGITRQLRHRLDELEMKRAYVGAPDGPTCGEIMPSLLGGPLVRCILPPGHMGAWHRGDNGNALVPPTEWTPTREGAERRRAES